MLTDEYGLPPVEPDPMRAAIATFLAFLVAGFVPLLPFIFSVPKRLHRLGRHDRVVFFGIGAAKSIWSLSPWWKSGLETLFIGGAAAAVAYFVGSLFAA
jgi:VIT1/CCC1 family predicted Fe2+/Mn2+ transporter